jgi:3-methyladenine DNA glycosylase AlkD
MSTDLIAQLRLGLLTHANPETKRWWENYVKDSAPFMGVKMPNIRKELHGWHRAAVNGALDHAQQVDLALALFDGDTSEEKLAGTLFLQEILLPVGAVNCDHHGVRFAALFTEGKIYDWNLCDWFCVKVLGPLIRMHGPVCAERIGAWRDADNLWQARASLVAFLAVVDESRYYSMIADSCRILIRREERFAKTAVGWVLHDVAKHDAPFVRQLLDENIAHFSIESLKNATKYFAKDIQSHYRELFKAARRTSGQSANPP